MLRLAAVALALASRPGDAAVLAAAASDDSSPQAGVASRLKAADGAGGAPPTGPVTHSPGGGGGSPNLHDAQALLAATLAEAEALFAESPSGVRQQQQQLADSPERDPGGGACNASAGDVCEAEPASESAAEHPFERLEELQRQLDEQLFDVQSLQDHLEQTQTLLVEAHAAREAAAKRHADAARRHQAFQRRRLRRVCGSLAVIAACAHAPKTLRLLMGACSIAAACTPGAVKRRLRALPEAAPATAAWLSRLAGDVGAEAPRLAHLVARFTRRLLAMLLRCAALLFLAVLRVVCDVMDMLRGGRGGDDAEAPTGDAKSGERLHAQWTAFMSGLGEQEASGEEPTAEEPAEDTGSDGDVSGPPEQDAAAPDTPGAAHARYKRYARAAAVAGGEGESSAPAVPEPQLTPEAEVDRLLRLRDGPEPGAGHSRRAMGRAAWLTALRVKSNASQGDIAKAHRKLSGRVHPDKCAHPRAGEAQAVLNAARDGLLGVRRHAGFFSPQRRRPDDVSM